MSTLADLTSNLQIALTTGTTPLFSLTTCLYAFDPMKMLQNPPNDQFCVIAPTQLIVKDRSWQGQGNVNYIYSWHCSVWLFVRLTTDEAGREDSYLLDPTYGCLQLADNVIGVLQDYYVNEIGYELDEVHFATQQHNEVGWNYVQLSYHSDLSSRSG